MYAECHECHRTCTRSVSASVERRATQSRVSERLGETAAAAVDLMDIPFHFACANSVQCTNKPVFRARVCVCVDFAFCIGLLYYCCIYARDVIICEYAREILRSCWGPSVVVVQRGAEYTHVLRVMCSMCTTHSNPNPNICTCYVTNRHDAR